MSRTLLVTPAEMAAGWVVRPDPADLVAAAAPCIRWTLTEAGWRVA